MDFFFSRKPAISVAGFLFYRQVLNNLNFGRGFWVLVSGWALGYGFWCLERALGTGVRHCVRWMSFGWSKIMRICLTPSGEFE
jgi:hypothetical protein